MLRPLLLSYSTTMLFLAVAKGSFSDHRSPLVGARFPPSFSLSKAALENNTNNGDGHDQDEDCKAGAICVGPTGDHYSIGHEPGVMFTSRFDVPELPKSHDSRKTCYYDYYNIFWRQQPKGGFMNQFVPQLMLGNALANSTNFPDYNPQWIALDEWHIGAQYFMGLSCNDTTASHSQGRHDDPCWIAKAATGKLVKVEPGETIETTFELVQVSDEMDWQWILRMGVVGAHPRRWSEVVVRKPFMGLVVGTTWQDDIYQNVTVGSCLENYGKHSRDNYPHEWKIMMDVLKPDHTRHEPFDWDDWRLDYDQCSWMPHSTIGSVQGTDWQRATWTARLDSEQTAR